MVEKDIGAENSKNPWPLPGVSFHSSARRHNGSIYRRGPAYDCETPRPVERQDRYACLSQLRPYFFFRRKEVQEVALSTGVAWLIVRVGSRQRHEPMGEEQSEPLGRRFRFPNDHEVQDG